MVTGGGEVRPVRQVFHVLLLLVATVVVAIGLSGLLGRLLQPPDLLDTGSAALARNVTFTVIGLPLLAGLLLWVARLLRADADERRSPGWAVLTGVTGVTALVVTMVAGYGVLSWALGLAHYDGRALAQLLVWGTLLAAVRVVEARVLPAGHAVPHRVVAALVGLGTSAVALATLLATAVEQLAGPLAREPLLAAGADPVLAALAALVVGAVGWGLSWWPVRRDGGVLWLLYVLLTGVAAGLLTALTAASVLLYDVLVWLVGDPAESSAAGHFTEVEGQLSAVVVGLLLWWYHHAVLEAAGEPGRTEVRRVYEYLMAAVGLLVASAGLATVLVAGIEALARGRELVVTGGAVNTLLAALTMLAVGGPVWWLYQGRTRRAVGREPAEAGAAEDHVGRAAAAEAAELASPTRRTYLLLIVGVSTVAVVVALLVAVFLLLEDAFEGRFGAETLRQARFALAALVTTGLVAGYHWRVYGRDRAARW
ncbi:DUF5671 domain-containing protein [Ornithinicoccus halotolerans]|uniref:DUF5671 domain-containing protein n=1 Tax=Ornithinicoccus halotolerans TaxID=1748220 RepID=UPI0012962BBE|nr:DUF5671 domain-containing protein [Ornithinicoccus halotolerans]